MFACKVLGAGDNLYKMAKVHGIEPYKIYYHWNNIEYRAQYPVMALVPVGTILNITDSLSFLLVGGVPIQADCQCSKVLTLEGATEMPACCPYTIFVGSYIINGMTYKGYSDHHNRIRFHVTDENNMILNAMVRRDYMHTETTPLAITLFLRLSILIKPSRYILILQSLEKKLF